MISISDAEEVREEEGVVVATDFMFMCSEAGQRLIEDDIRSGKVNAGRIAFCVHDSAWNI